MELKNLLEPFLFVHDSPYHWMNELKGSHHLKAIGFLFPDVPEEMIHAFGVLPVSISGTGKDIKQAHGYLPSFTCAFNVGPFESALEGKLDAMDGLVIPYACDSMRAFSQVWEATFPHFFSHTLWLPKKKSGIDPKVFFKQELFRMKDALTRFIGRGISDQQIRESIKTYNHNRGLLRNLNQYRLEYPTSLSNADFMTIARASTAMPKNEHSERLEELLDALKNIHVKTGSLDAESSRIFLFGTVCEHREIYRCIDRAKMAVVDDNLYNGTRYYGHDVEEDGDPIDNLVDRHFRRDPMSCYQYSIEDWRQFIRERIVQNHVEGVVYLVPKYCEVLQFDYPMVKAVLEESDIPIILVETDYASSSIAQIEIRIEAFAEMLRGQKSEII